MVKYVFGSNSFKTKKEIQNYLKQYKDSKCAGDIVEEPYLTVLLGVYQWHPEYDETWMSDDMIFKISKDERFGEMSYVVINNGRVWDFSYLKCIKGGTKEKNKRFNVMNTARTLIKDQIYEFRDKNKIKVNGSIKFKCEIDGKLYNPTDIHIDHNYEKLTFLTILDNFLTENNLTYETIPLVDDGEFYHNMTEKHKKLWKEYHKKNAILRCIFKTYNLSGQ